MEPWRWKSGASNQVLCRMTPSWIRDRPAYRRVLSATVGHKGVLVQQFAWNSSCHTRDIRLLTLSVMDDTFADLLGEESRIPRSTSHSKHQDGHDKCDKRKGTSQHRSTETAPCTKIFSKVFVILVTWPRRRIRRRQATIDSEMVGKYGSGCENTKERRRLHIY